ncbi:MAG: glycosyltransferase family 4 protein [Gammaproteobacteria bacterium]|nr:glycosyltransferase family 4 protein [Gammaproteobacteria bacterium]
MEKIGLSVRILVISQYFWPENFRVNDLVQELTSRGHELTVLTGIPNYPDGNVFDEFKENPSIFTEYHAAKVVRVPMLPRSKGALRLICNYVSFMLSASSIGVWKLKDKSFDVIFVFEPSPITVGLPAIILRTLKNAPLLFWVLDLWPETLAAIGIIKSKKILDFVGCFVRFIYNRCDLVLGQSKSFFNSISKYCSDYQKIRYFPSWAEDVFSSDLNVPAASEIPMSLNSFDIVFAGNVGEAQDFPAILQAAGILKKTDLQIRWLIVGDGRMAPWVKEQIIERGLENHILMLGRYPVERMPSFYACADALLVSLKPDPVFSMTIPGKVQSYLMSGIPLLGMLDGEGANVIHEANAGLCCAAGDSEGLAKAVVAMVEMSYQQRNQLGQNGRIYAESEFSREKLINTLESWFTEVIKKNNKVQ